MTLLSWGRAAGAGGASCQGWDEECESRRSQRSAFSDKLLRHWGRPWARHRRAAREAPTARLVPLAAHGTERHQAIRCKYRAVAVPGTIRCPPQWSG